MKHEREIRDLRALLEVSRAMAGIGSLENLLRIIVEKASEVLEADRCTLFLYDELKNEIWSRIATQLGDLREIRLPLGVGVAGKAAATWTASNVPDAYSDPDFNPDFDRQTGYRTRSILCVPMISSRGKLIGVIEALNKKGVGVFDGQDESLLEALASHAAVALERAQLTEAYLEKQRTDQMLSVAHDLQMSLLPRKFPPFPNLPQLDLYAALAPAKEVGGDFYDFFLLDDRRLFFAIGDVSGKGVPAALMMAIAKTLLRAAARKTTGPDRMVTEVNAELCSNEDSHLFVSLFCGILNTQTGEVLYTNAGHNPPLLVGPGNRAQYMCEGKGIVVGVTDQATYETQSLKLEPGAYLLLYTDGVTEAANGRREFFSEERLKEQVSSGRKESSRELVEGVMDGIRVFTQGMPQADDIAMMSVRLIP